VAVTRLSGGNTPADGADPRTFPAIWNGTADDLEAGEYSKVPSGGVQGQVLTKTSATDYAAAWQQPGLAVPPPVAGLYLTQFIAGAVANEGTTNNALFAQVIFVPRPVTVDEIAIEVTVAGASPSEARLGIYASNADGVPSSLIVDAGLIDATSPGTKTIALSPAATLPAGFVFLAFARQSANTFSSRRMAVTRGAYPRPNSAADALANAPRVHQFFMANVTGALPATFTPSGVGGAMYLMAVKIASVL
jgi:hypothetical protein